MQKPPKHSEPEYERVKTALEVVLASEKFLPAPQMSAFLRYVVMQAISGHKNRIKAYTVAVDALGKPDTFDPQNDPVVRVLAGRLRSTLKAYYEANEDADVIIQMKPGSYVPNFVLKDQPQQPVKDKGSAHAPHTTATLPFGPTNLSVDITHTNHIPWSMNSSVEAQPPPSDSMALTYKTANDHIAAPPPRKLLLLPSLAAGVALLGVVLLGVQMNMRSGSEEPSIAAGTPTDDGVQLKQPRPRPENLSLFISAKGASNSLEKQLHTIISGVFSESQDISVYRPNGDIQVTTYWPEDYIVTLDILRLPHETQAKLQLLEAQTSRISHTATLTLSADARSGLSNNELATIMNAARTLVAEGGPLRSDYANKTTD